MKTLYFDVDTQLDFLSSAGALAVPGAAAIAPALGVLTRFAISAGIQILSTVDTHAEDDPEFRVWRPHCVAGTQGQQKYSETLSPKSVVVRPGSEVHSAPQLVLEKQTIDLFQCPRLGPLLASIAAERYVVYGLVTEYCVSSAAFGLLETSARVELVTDAIKGINRAAAEETIERFKAQGGHLITVEQALSPAI